MDIIGLNTKKVAWTLLTMLALGAPSMLSRLGMRTMLDSVDSKAAQKLQEVTKCKLGRVDNSNNILIIIIAAETNKLVTN